MIETLLNKFISVSKGIMNWDTEKCRREIIARFKELERENKELRANLATLHEVRVPIEKEQNAYESFLSGQ